MSKITQAEKYLLDQIRRGETDAWTQLVNRYQGRLSAFAQASLSQRADAEDVVQETFISFLKSLADFRQEAGLETYLFTILRHKIIDSYRTNKSKVVCLIRDIHRSGDSGDSSDAFGKMPGAAPTASWYVMRDEQLDLQRQALADSLTELINNYKKSLNFRDLQIIELLFYGHLTNKKVAQELNMNEKAVAVIKHRCLKQLRRQITLADVSSDQLSPEFENLLTGIWESLRPSCPKRSTIGAYLLETLELPWHDYVHFHLNKLGCHFCRANLDDLKQQNKNQYQSTFKQKIMESTVGFLHKI